MLCDHKKTYPKLFLVNPTYFSEKKMYNKKRCLQLTRCQSHSVLSSLSNPLAAANNQISHQFFPRNLSTWMLLMMQKEGQVTCHFISFRHTPFSSLQKTHQSPSQISLMHILQTYFNQSLFGDIIRILKYYIKCLQKKKWCPLMKEQGR